MDVSWSAPILLRHMQMGRAAEAKKFLSVLTRDYGYGDLYRMSRRDVFRLDKGWWVHLSPEQRGLLYRFKSDFRALEQYINARFEQINNGSLTLQDIHEHTDHIEAVTHAWYARQEAFDLATQTVEDYVANKTQELQDRADVLGNVEDPDYQETVNKMSLAV